MNKQLCTFNNALDASQFVVSLLCATANDCIKKNGRFVIILAGGTSPKTIYTLLKDQPQPWEKWHLIYGDERHLPNDDANRNSNLVNHCWTNNLAIPIKQHHIMPYQPNLSTTAKAYEKEISALLPADFALLGIGEDGHTASLFPNNLALNSKNNKRVLAINNADKPPAQRISLNYASLNKTATICLLGFGEKKMNIIKQWQHNSLLPFNHIHGTQQTFLITDYPFS